MALIVIVRGLPSSDMGRSDHFLVPLKIQILWGERYLVGGLEPWNLCLSIYWEYSSQLTNSYFFRGAAQPPTRYTPISDPFIRRDPPAGSFFGLKDHAFTLFLFIQFLPFYNHWMIWGCHV